jgi:hypothetical protein
MNSQPRLQDIARQQERICNELYALKGQMMHFKGVLKEFVNRGCHNHPMRTPHATVKQ